MKILKWWKTWSIIREKDQNWEDNTGKYWSHRFVFFEIHKRKKRAREISEKSEFCVIASNSCCPHHQKGRYFARRVNDSLEFAKTGQYDGDGWYGSQPAASCERERRGLRSRARRQWKWGYPSAADAPPPSSQSTLSDSPRRTWNGEQRRAKQSCKEFFFSET